METSYEISLNMKTLKGIETYGCFQLGNDEAFARRLYGSLLAEEEVSVDSVITRFGKAGAWCSFPSGFAALQL